MSQLVEGCLIGFAVGTLATRLIDYLCPPIWGAK